jgi:hypothetical protein
MGDEMNDVGSSADDDGGGGGKEEVVVHGCSSGENDHRRQTRAVVGESCWF